MKKAYIISTGTEILLGKTIDVNANYISQELADLGIMLVGISVVGDNEENIRKAFELGMKSADLIIATGGLGPTKDDLTKKVACEVMGAELVLFDDEVDRLKEFFAQRNKKMPQSNLKQAMFPSNAIILNNPLGTAPGMYMKQDETAIILLPGPPKEMKRVFIEQVRPLLIKEFNLMQNLSVNKVIKVFGPGESQVEEMISHVIDNSHGCSIALIAEAGEILIKITAEGHELTSSEKILAQIVEEIKIKLGHDIYGFDDDDLKTVVLQKLIKKDISIALAESCTGGLLSTYVTDVPGSSAVFWGGIISYSNEAKINLLGVAPKTLETYGAVSPETAEEMAKGVKKISQADLGLAITGIAGPGGGSQEKPVGTVYIALASDRNVRVKRLAFVGDRSSIRILAAKSGLDIIRRKLEFGGL